MKEHQQMNTPQSSLMTPTASSNHNAPGKTKLQGKGHIHFITGVEKTDPLLCESIIVGDHVVTVISGGQQMSIPMVQVLYIVWA
jgi:hypothetical protein